MSIAQFRDGKVSRLHESRPSRLETAPLEDVSEWLEGFRRQWEERLAHLDDYLRELQEEGGTG